MSEIYSLSKYEGNDGIEGRLNESPDPRFLPRFFRQTKKAFLEHYQKEKETFKSIGPRVLSALKKPFLHGYRVDFIRNNGKFIAFAGLAAVVDAITTSWVLNDRQGYGIELVKTGQQFMDIYGVFGGQALLKSLYGGAIVLGSYLLGPIADEFGRGIPLVDRIARHNESSQTALIVSGAGFATVAFQNVLSQSGFNV